METSRNSLHEKAMILIYDALTYQSMNMDYDIQAMTSDLLEIPFEQADIFLKQVVVASLVHQNEIVDELQLSMKKWKFSRLNRVMQAILLLSVSHYRFIKEVDKVIVIDIAVKLSKKYLDDGEHKFVNAILDSML